jgi:hypothetical protein
MTYTQTIEDLRSKLTERSLKSPALEVKLRQISQNTQLCIWLEKLPTIPEGFIDILHTKDVDHFITEIFLWRLWAFWLVEEHRDAPVINSTIDINAYADHPKMRKSWPTPPFNTAEEVAEAVDWDRFPLALDHEKNGTDIN